MQSIQCRYEFLKNHFRFALFREAIHKLDLFVALILNQQQNKEEDEILSGDACFNFQICF